MTLRHELSMREFVALKENVQILEFLDAANDQDQFRERKKEERKTKR